MAKLQQWIYYIIGNSNDYSNNNKNGNDIALAMVVAMTMP